MDRERKSQPVEAIRSSTGENFLPEEVVNRVDDLFIVREFDGPIVEKRLSIRRPLFERALRYAILRRLDPNGPKAMGRAASSMNRFSIVTRKVG